MGLSLGIRSSDAGISFIGMCIAPARRLWCSSHASRISMMSMASPASRRTFNSFGVISRTILTPEVGGRTRAIIPCPHFKLSIAFSIQMLHLGPGMSHCLLYGGIGCVDGAGLLNVAPRFERRGRQVRQIQPGSGILRIGLRHLYKIVPGFLVPPAEERRHTQVIGNRYVEAVRQAIDLSGLDQEPERNEQEQVAERADQDASEEAAGGLPPLAPKDKCRYQCADQPTEKTHDQEQLDRIHAWPALLCIL